MFDIFLGRRPSKKQRKRIQLEENIEKGRAAENAYQLKAALRGVEVERTGRGHDFIERRRDFLTGRVTSTTRVEVKSSRTAPLSPLQKKMKKRKGRYRVYREEPILY